MFLSNKPKLGNKVSCDLSPPCPPYQYHRMSLSSHNLPSSYFLESLACPVSASGMHTSSIVHHGSPTARLPSSPALHSSPHNLLTACALLTTIYNHLVCVLFPAPLGWMLYYGRVFVCFVHLVHPP